MKLLVFVISLALNSAFSQDSHELSYVLGCPKNGTAEVFFVLDGDLALRVDFQNNEVVVTFPPYIHIDIGPYPNLFKNAMKAKRSCLVGQTVAEELFKDSPPEVQDPPETMLYPADEVQRGVENSLVCFVDRFFPPPIKVTWTKNNRPVSKEVSISSNMPNKDQTFRAFSILTFYPEHGDVYSCTVEHSALDTPKTRIWDVDLKSIHEDLAFDFYCGVGLTVAFVGVTVGTFLIMKVRYNH